MLLSLDSDSTVHLFCVALPRHSHSVVCPDVTSRLGCSEEKYPIPVVQVMYHGGCDLWTLYVLTRVPGTANHC